MPCGNTRVYIRKVRNAEASIAVDGDVIRAPFGTLCFDKRPRARFLKAFDATYPDPQIVQQLAAQLLWSHN